MIHLVINKNAYQQRSAASSLRFARAMVIRANINHLLDLDRAAFCENVDDLENHTKVIVCRILYKLVCSSVNLSIMLSLDF